MGPVAAPVGPPARPQGVSSALIGFVALGVLAGGSWFVHERSSAHPSVSNGVTQAVHADAARPAAAPKASPASATGAVRSLDLDQDSSTAHAVLPNNAAPSNAAPSNAAPSNAAPSNAAPSNAAPSNAAPSNAAPGNAAPNAAAPSSAKAAKLEQPTLAAVSERAEPQEGAEPQAPTTPSTDGAVTIGDETTTQVTETPASAALPPFDAQAAKRALTSSALSASSCRKGDDPRGTAEVIVTFAPSGRITSANVNGAPYGGTATGGCVAATLRGATVPPFAGNHVTVRKLVSIR